MNTGTDGIPDYLKRYVVPDRTLEYTPEEHATWRYIMQQNLVFFSKHAVPIYVEGLKKTGITIDRIPQIAAIDHAMQSNLGWRAVPVRGFIPPAAFLDFQSRKILPIAADMRRLDHLLYTPAPDVVHEGAGHAPIIADPAYSDYLMLYANVAKRAIMSCEDQAQFRAIRTLSDLKESPEATHEDVAAAESELTRTTEAISYVSEAARVARMYWWTAEYGLVGSMAHPLIYGAGLLSSVGEGQACLDPRVRKIPLDLRCVDQSYDITRPQPQLFVAEGLDHLTEVLRAFEATLAFRRGGAFALAEAQRSRTVNCIEFESGALVAGVVKSVMLSERGDPQVLAMAGVTQVGVGDSEIEGGGTDRQPSDPVIPFGRWTLYPDRSPGDLSDSDLLAAGVGNGRAVALSFVGGLAVEGTLDRAVWAGSKLVALALRSATVKRGEQVLWRHERTGSWFLPIGEGVVSVRSGSIDERKFSTFEFGESETVPGRQRPFSSAEQAKFADYERIRQLREDLRTKRGGPASRIGSELRDLSRRHPGEWLLRFECVETAMIAKVPEAPAWRDALLRDFGDRAQLQLIRKGLDVIGQAEGVVGVSA